MSNVFDDIGTPNNPAPNIYGCMPRTPGGVFEGTIPLGPITTKDDLTLTLQDRGKEYGDYTHMAQVAQSIKMAMRIGAHFHHMGFAQQESLDLIATKIARLVCGNPMNPDSWLDIEGYAKLARERCVLSGTATP